MATTMKLIAKVSVGLGGASSIEFTSIPGIYTDLLVTLSARSDRSAAVADWAYVSFNGSTSNFSAIAMEGSGNVVSNYNSFPRIFGLAAAASATADAFGNSESYVPNYAGSSNKSWSTSMVAENNATEAYAGIVTGLWSNTAAITSIILTPRIGANWLQHSSAFLYGITKA